MPAGQLRTTPTLATWRQIGVLATCTIHCTVCDLASVWSKVSWMWLLLAVQYKQLDVASFSSTVQTVASFSSTVQTVASFSSTVQTVASFSSTVQTVASFSSTVQTVALQKSEFLFR